MRVYLVLKNCIFIKLIINIILIYNTNLKAQIYLLFN
jgi:hypothetical protein